MRWTAVGGELIRFDRRESPRDRWTILVGRVRSSTSFIGRDRDLAAVRRTLDDGARLITLCGPPGVGKSRVARELVAQLAGEEGSEVFFCDLAGARDRADLFARVCVAIGSPVPARDVGTGVGLLLAEHPQLVLVVDDADHVVAVGAGVLRAWLDVAPGLSLVVTSRERLGVAGEQLIELAPLARDDAVALFDQRAAAVDPTWDHAAHRRLIGQIVNRLDRLPMAIELVAARMELLGPADLLALLEQRRSAAPALTAAIEESWHGLSPVERSALAQLSIFRGNFTLTAADAICALPGDAPLVEALQALRRKSLLLARPNPAHPGRARFHLYETVRRLAGQKLDDTGSRAAAARRHAAYFATVREATEAELPDLLAVVESTAQPAVTLGAALAAEPLFWRSGRAREIVALFNRVLDAVGPDDLEPAQRARALELRGRAHRVAGDMAAARADLDDALVRWVELGDRASAARTHREVGALAMVQGRFDAARAALTAAARAQRECGDRSGEATTLDTLAGVIYQSGGDIAEARGLALDALRITRELGLRDKEAIQRGHLGLLALESGALDEASEQLDAALAIHRELGNVRFEAAELNNLGLLARERGDPAEGARRIGRALALFRSVGDVKGAAEASIDLGVCREESGDLTRAGAAFGEALHIARLIDDRRTIAAALSHLGRVAARQGRSSSARAAWDEAAQVTADGSFPHARAILDVSRAHLDPEARDIVPVDNPTSSYRAVCRILRAGEQPAATVLVVDDAARSYRLGSDDPVSLAERPTLWRLLSRLARARQDAPGQPISRDELFAAGWPGEQIASRSAAGRVRSAVWALRKSGLGSVLTGSTEGYALTVDVAR